MKLPVRRIRVFPNPWGIHPHWTVADPKRLKSAKPHSAAMDHVGRPCGVVAMDPIGDGGARGRFVGAKVDEERTVSAQLQAGDDIRSPRQETVYSFLGCSAHETEPFELGKKLAASEPIEIPFTEYYRALVLDGCLIAADQESAKACGTEKFFSDPKTLLPKLAELAATAFDEQYEGEEAYRHFVSERAAAAKKPETTEAPTTAPATKSSKKPTQEPS